MGCCVNRKKTIKEGIQLKVYKCEVENCKYITGSRKLIRKHIRYFHNIKGGKISIVERRDPLSTRYRSVDI
jgi:hypothetical protein